MRRLTFAIIATIAAATLVAAGRGPAATSMVCTDGASGTRPLNIHVDGELARGAYAVPSSPPRAIVAVAHGYGHDSGRWQEDLARLSEELQVVAFAMDYRGTYVDDDGDIRGWQVVEGAADTNAAAALLAERCRVDTVALFGISMGGNASGLAVAAQPTLGNGEPLYDWWIDVEGAVDLTEEYLLARAAAGSGNAYARKAYEDMVAEFGGDFENEPQAYLDATVVLRAGDIAASGVLGVVIVHGVDDGLVPYDQSRQLAARLAEQGVSYELYTVARRSDTSQGQTSATGYVGGVVDSGYSSPFAGHASETNEAHPVMAAAYARLASLLDGEPLDCTREYLVDLETTTLLAGTC